jgi:hypothetical protein
MPPRRSRRRHVRPNVERVLQSLRPDDVVVDVGGWAQPFARANFIVDLMPYETRGVFGSLGPGPERFSADTWLQTDICVSRLPFADKSVDFLICSHTLEDIRNPIWLCQEINRVAKRGYIEVPSRRMESIRNLEHRGYPGYYHHRWLVEVGRHDVIFRFKTPLMSSSWRFTFPKSYLRALKGEDRVSWLFWEGKFRYHEVIQISEDKVAEELEAFVRTFDVYPDWRYALERARPRPRLRVKQFLKRTKRFRPLADRLLGRQILMDEEQLWGSLPDHQSK